MRFPVVLFDFDGTVLDSGEIILASMRHATQIVLGRDIEDEVLMAAVGGSGHQRCRRNGLAGDHAEVGLA